MEATARRVTGEEYLQQHSSSSGTDALARRGNAMMKRPAFRSCWKE